MTEKPEICIHDRKLSEKCQDCLAYGAYRRMLKGDKLIFWTFSYPPPENPLTEPKAREVILD